MGLIQHKIPDHLNYFLCIEDDIALMSRWIDISEPNYECFSVELARLLMTASAEADVIARLVCKNIDPKSKASGIYSYQEILVKEFPRIVNARVTVPRFGIELKPWSNWEKEKTPPLWWQANNKVKHHRSEHFNRATLKNVLNAVAGLLILILLYYAPKRRSFTPGPRLFEPQTFGYKDGDGLVFSIKVG